MIYSLNPPDGQSPEAWLVRYDASPSIVPHWPASTRMVLVAVSDDGPLGTIAALLTEPNDVNEFVRRRTLYFVVPRTVITAPGTCPEFSQG